jgi:hypothetical protein
MEKIIKEHISQNLEETKVYFRYSGIYYISEKFIDGIANTFSISRSLVLYYLKKMVNQFVLDADNDVIKIYNEYTEIFERNHNMLDVIDDFKKTKLKYASEQNYAVAAQYRQDQKILEMSITNKWDSWLKFINETTD